MISVTGFEEQPRANSPAKASRLARGMAKIRGLRAAVTAAVAAGMAIAITSCSSPTPATHGDAGSSTSAPVTVASAPPPATASSSAATGSMCSFIVGGATTCDRTDPDVQVYANFGDDTTGCAWVRNIDWGDGITSKSIVVHGGPAGPKFVDNHTYSAPGTYTIFFGGKVTQGSCTIVTPVFHFKLQG
jgi:hypothetical protein